MFTISFFAHGGAGTMADQNFSNGVAQNLSPNVFVRDNADFAGWSTDISGCGPLYADEASMTFTSSDSLYAQWKTWCTGTALLNEKGDGRIDSVYDHEGNAYAVVQIGDQCWLKENMRCTSSPKGLLSEGKTTSYKVFTKDELSKRDVKGFEEGVNPKAINCSKDETYEKVEKMVTSLRAKGYKDIVVLTAKEENTSSLYERASGESLFFGGFKCLFTTCRKFKGLEAEAIIITDLDGDVLLNGDKRLLFYVGASRAKFDLNLVFNLTAEECKQWLDKSGHKSPFFSPNLLYTAFETEMFK